MIRFAGLFDLNLPFGYSKYLFDKDIEDVKRVRTYMGFLMHH